MNAIQRWLKTTFDYNPTFPLSALLLMLGLGQLPLGSLLDHQLIFAKLGVLSIYEFALISTALLFLWPRRIAYETTAILIIFNLVRFAAPFLALGAANEARATAPLAIGAILTVLALLQQTWLRKSLPLDLHSSERKYDLAFYAIAALALPSLARLLSFKTGAGISHDTARLIQLAVWWTGALALAPLALGLSSGLGSDNRPLRSRRPALVWRATLGLLAPIFLAQTFFAAGASLRLIDLAPVILAILAIFNAVLRNTSLGEWQRLDLVPAVLAMVMVSGSPTSLGLWDSVNQGAIFLAFLPLAAGAVLLIRPSEPRRGLLALATIIGLSPLLWNHSLLNIAQFGSLASLCIFVLAIIRRSEGLAAAALLSLAVSVEFLCAVLNVPQSLLAVAAVATAGSLAAAMRGFSSNGLVTPGLLYLRVLLPYAFSAQAELSAGCALTVLGLSFSATCLLAGHRKLATSSLAALLLALSRHALIPILTHIPPGLSLIALAFGSLPFGAWLAVKREGRLVETAELSSEQQP